MNNYDYYLNDYQRFNTNDYNSIPTIDMQSNINPNINISQNTNDLSLYNPVEGFDKGNLFSNLYDTYKNHRPKTLTAKTEQEQKFLDMSRSSFAAHELNLYLDVYPNNSSIIRLFNDYREKADNLRIQYEKKYGPMTISSIGFNNESPFIWVEQNWPWEGGLY